jgi:hypothetical protein
MEIERYGKKKKFFKKGNPNWSNNINHKRASKEKGSRN